MQLMHADRKASVCKYLCSAGEAYVKHIFLLDLGLDIDFSLVFKQVACVLHVAEPDSMMQWITPLQAFLVRLRNSHDTVSVVHT